MLKLSDHYCPRPPRCLDAYRKKLDREEAAQKFAASILAALFLLQLILQLILYASILK